MARKDTVLAVEVVEVSMASSAEVVCLAAKGSEGGRHLTAWDKLSLHSFKMERALSVALHERECIQHQQLLSMERERFNHTSVLE